MQPGIKDGRKGAINFVGCRKSGETFIFAFYDRQLPKLIAELERLASASDSPLSDADAQVVSAAARRVVSK